MRDSDHDEGLSTEAAGSGPGGRAVPRRPDGRDSSCTVVADPGLPDRGVPALPARRARRATRDSRSRAAYYWIAVPADWNGTLVVHAHGGPDLGAASPERSSTTSTGGR